MLRASIEAAGGFVAIVRRGDADAGGLCVLAAPQPRDAQTAGLWEWRTGFDGRAGFVDVTPDAARDDADLGTARLDALLERRLSGDPDLWGIHLDIPSAPRFIARLTHDD